MYRILGADGQIYGPAAAEQVRQWITENRATAQSQSLAEGATEWKPLGTLPEFANCFAPPVPPPLGPPPPAAAPTTWPRKTNPFATAGMILGIVSFACCFKVVFGTLGLVFSLVGLSQINQQPQRYEGRGLAIAGLVLSILSLLLAFGMGLFLLLFHPPHFFFRFGRF